jgi:hypothetical protein
MISNEYILAEEVRPQVVDRLSPKERHDVNIRESFCSKSEEMRGELLAIQTHLDSEECSGETSGKNCLLAAAENYQKKLAEYFIILTGTNLLNSGTEFITNKARKKHFIESHKAWLKYQSVEFKSIEAFYDGDWTMYPRAIASRKVDILGPRSKELLGYIIWHCYNS